MYPEQGRKSRTILHEYPSRSPKRIQKKAVKALQFYLSTPGNYSPPC